MQPEADAMIACKLIECLGKPRCHACLAMDAAYPLPDHDNHHNALKCPYCNPQRLVLVAQTVLDEIEQLRIYVRQADNRGDEALRRAHAAEALLQELLDCGAVTNWLRVSDELKMRVQASVKGAD